MAANNENAMARFLFAILRQKCLKDIDWNKVASDPVLLQPITNGHAARMRYSRFRSAMLGLEPQRRNRASAGGFRVSKSRKDKDNRDLGKPVKSEKESEAHNDEVLETQTIAPEPHGPASPATTGLFPDGHVHFQNRLMTPCSDTDILIVPQGFASSPVNETFDFPVTTHSSREHGSWHHHSPPYPTFGMPYELDGFPPGFCETTADQEQHHSRYSPEQSEGIRVPTVVMDPDPQHVGVKHETWDNQYHHSV